MYSFKKKLLLQNKKNILVLILLRAKSEYIFGVNETIRGEKERDG